MLTLALIALGLVIVERIVPGPRDPEQRTS